MKITVLAAGTWGTALSCVLAPAHDVTLWTKNPAQAEELTKTRRHPNLPDTEIPDPVSVTTDLERAVRSAEVIINAVPSPFIREVSEKIKPYYGVQVIACVAKGLEAETHFTMTEIITDVLGNVPVVALSGPTHAEEAAVGLPTLIVSASEDTDAAETVQRLFLGTCIRAYTNTDVLGVEICGALKNIIALACGISQGLGYGDNTRVAIITRGVAEIARLGLKMGCRLETFAGLSGVGDVVVTATSEHSRNFRCGRLIGKGVPPEEAVRQIGMVVEGINALDGALSLSEKYGISLPIIEQVNKVVRGKTTPETAVKTLFLRDFTAE